jgi:hypothetical protein
MLADRNAGREQDRMNRPDSAARVVDIVAVDPDQRRPLLDQPLRRRGGEERMILAIGVGAPVPVPAGVDQNRLSADVEPLEIGGIGR